MRLIVEITRALSVMLAALAFVTFIIYATHGYTVPALFSMIGMVFAVVSFVSSNHFLRVCFYDS